MRARARMAWAALLATALLGCAREEARPDLLLVSVDTLRADHVGSYGYERETTPRLDALAARSLRYARAFAPTPWTLPSHAALLTGRHPWDMGVVGHRSRIPEGVPMLAERLGAAGYDAAAFVDSRPGGFVGARRGFERGFALYRHAPHPGGGPYRHDAARTVDAALRWLDARPAADGTGEASGRRPFFLFLHTKTVHATSGRTTRVTGRDVPYDTPDPHRARFLEGGSPRFGWRHPSGERGVGYLMRWNEWLARGERRPGDFGEARRAELVALYDAGIAYVDRQLGRLLDGLRVRGLEEGTAVVVVSDHGEAFLEHRLLLHKELYEPLLRVPLLVRAPGAAEGRVVETPVALRDVAPTLLAIAGLPPLAGASGRALPPWGAPPERERSFFAFYRSGLHGLYEGLSLRVGGLKVLHHRFASDAALRTEAYDLRRDPAEARPLAEPPPQAEVLRERLAERARAGPEASPRLELDAETREALRALGYVD